MTAQIKHVAISSGNNKLLIDFYASVFGMTHDRNNVVTDGYVGMNVNGRGRGRQEGIDHFGIEVDDVEAVMARSRELYPQINFLTRPSNRPFAGIGTHDPAGNIFDLSASGRENRVGFYADGADEWHGRHIDHFGLRALHPEQLATFYHDVYGLEANKAADGSFAITDGRVTLLIAPWNILDYTGTGIERPAIDHIGFKVESLDAFKRDLDQLMESRPELFPPQPNRDHEGDRRVEILAGCARGELQLCDPDGIMLDVTEKR
jgi:predicted enzyme related to lactoylglutathione lyase